MWIKFGFELCVLKIAYNGKRLCDAVPRQRKLILTKNFIKMKNSSTETFTHGIAKPMLCEVVGFKNIFYYGKIIWKIKEFWYNNVFR